MDLHSSLEGSMFHCFIEILKLQFFFFLRIIDVKILLNWELKIIINLGVHPFQPR